MRRIGAFAVVLALALSACGEQLGGSGGSRAQPSDNDGFPVRIRAAGDSLRIEERPRRIVSLSPTATEILFAIGAGSQVVAVDDQSDYPPEAPTTDLSGYEPNIEAIASYRPDLVVASSNASLRPLKDLKIPLLVQPAPSTLKDAYAQFRQLGAATGQPFEAEKRVARMKEGIQRLVANAPRFDQPLTYYHELDDSYFTVTSDTFIGRVYGLLPLENIADEADKAGTGYPQLSPEYIIQADPDLIFLADSQCCNQTPSRVARRPGWNHIAAVENDAVFEVGDDISSRWGPRIVAFLRRVVAALRQVKSGP
jgi:iron complex transport system substrate-binding protein